MVGVGAFLRRVVRLLKLCAMWLLHHNDTVRSGEKFSGWVFGLGGRGEGFRKHFVPAARSRSLESWLEQVGWAVGEGGGKGVKKEGRMEGLGAWVETVLSHSCYGTTSR